jgi:hypothetical protein
MTRYELENLMLTISQEIRNLLMTLFLIFIVLKLTGLIYWSWFWVLSPLIISGIAAVIIMIIYSLIALSEKLRTKT